MSNVLDDTQGDLIARLLRETKPGLDEHRQRVLRFDHAYNVWRGVPPAPQVRDDFSARVRVKIAMQILDTALVNISTGNRPRCNVLARHPDFQANEKAFENVFTYCIDKDHLVEKEPLIVQSGLIYGIAIGKNNLGEGGLPTFEPWDVYDAWWDPNGRDVDSCDYFVLRSWPSKKDLLANACTHPKDHGRDECNGIYHNVEELISSGPASSRSYSAQDRITGSQQSIRKGRYEVWEIWHDDRVQVIGNRNILLRDDPNPYDHGKKPIVVACTRPDLRKIQGVPETELIDHIQQAFWTIQNLRLENEHLTVWRAVTYREGGVTDPDGIEIKPRAKIGVTDHDDLRPFEVQPLPPEAYRETEDLLNLGQYVTGINAFVSGGAPGGVDQNTATGVSVLSEVSSRLLRFKAARIKWGIWQRTFEQWGSMIQQFMDEPLWVRITGPGSETTFTNYSPDEIRGEFDYTLEGTDDSLSKQQDRQDAMAILNAMAPFAQLGVLNLPVLIEYVARKFGFENPEELINPQPQQGAPAAPLPPGGAPGPQSQPPMPTIPQQGITPGQNMMPQLQPGMQQAMVTAGGMNGQ